MVWHTNLRRPLCRRTLLRWNSTTKPYLSSVPHQTTETDNILNSASVSTDEVKKFSAISNKWWDASGPFKYLHAMNKTRVQYIRETLEDLYGKNATSRDLRVVDVGCGGGLATEPLARMGLNVLGIDASYENISIAKIHAKGDPILLHSGRLEYRQIAAEQLLLETEISEKVGAFDAVVSLEVIEHVNDPRSFIQSLVNLAKPTAPIFISTINRTILSYLVDVLVPEYLLRVIPAGTHEFDKFITPEELSNMFNDSNATTLDTRGLILDPVFNNCFLAPKHFTLLPNAGVQANYILVARKNPLTTSYAK